MRAAAERLVAPQFRAIVRLIDEPMLQPIYDLEVAAHGVRPGRDRSAMRLSWRGRMSPPASPRRRTMPRRWLQALRRGRRRAALKRYEAARLPENNRIIERARHLGAYLQATRTQEEQARAPAQHGTDGSGDRGNRGAGFLYA